MSNDKFQNKYDEIFQSIKEEKMDWDFEDFLKKAEGKKMRFRKRKLRLSRLTQKQSLRSRNGSGWRQV
ncbi:hypothetical protein [Chryseobacterium wanjuense]